MGRVAIIPARGGSQRIPRKNIRAFLGRPIMSYVIDAAHHSALFEHVYVSTEDDEIAEAAQRYGARVIWRPADLARDEVGTQDVLRHAVTALALGRDTPVCGIYATAVLVTPESLRAGLAALKARPVDYCLTVGREPMRDAGQWYWGWAWAFAEGRPLVSGETRLFPLDDDAWVDINTEQDWTRALRLYEARRIAGERG